MIRLCVGISSLSPAWISLIQQLGVEVEEIDFNKSISTSYSCLIINSNHSDQEIAKIDRFLTRESGGVLLFNNLELFKTSSTKSKISADIPAEFSQHISQFYKESGLFFTSSLNPEIELTSNSFIRKRFPFKTDYHPDELVSKTDRNRILKLIESLIRELHYHRKLPFIFKWYSPSVNPVFGFRIDTDYGDQDSIQNIYQLADMYSIPMTWFLHVQAHEEWLELFQSFEKQEIALHGYEHGTSDSYEHIRNNIERGYQLMVEAGLKPDGFCVPYSIWSDALGDVLEKNNFNYSAEFTLGYDTLPFYPIHTGKLHSTLQIPIHPICTGSLNRKKASENEMLSYFELVLDSKIMSNENAFFYHHPMQPGMSIWESIFQRINEHNFTKLTFNQFSTFWRSRLEANIDILYDLENKSIHCTSNSPNLILNISINSKEYYLIEASKVDKPLSYFQAFNRPKIQQYSKELRKELKRNLLQLWKTSILDWRNRHTL